MRSSILALVLLSLASPGCGGGSGPREEQARIGRELAEERAAQEAQAKAARAAKEAEQEERERAKQEARAAEIAALGPLTAWEAALLLDWAGQRMGDSERDDVLPEQPFKLSIYQDLGLTHINRARVDRDRDGAWDEKWTFGPEGSITRVRAPADDEVYSVRERWTGRGFEALP